MVARRLGSWATLALLSLISLLCCACGDDSCDEVAAELRECCEQGPAELREDCGKDLGVRAAMARIARDELRHAELSWRIERWLTPRLGREHRAMLTELDRALGMTP